MLQAEGLEEDTMGQMVALLNTIEETILKRDQQAEVVIHLVVLK